MFKRTRVSAAAALALGGVAIFAAAPVQAQDSQRIEITGSSIKRIDAETALPVTVVTREEIEHQGFTTVAQIVEKLSSSNGGGYNFSQSLGDSARSGQSGVSLRGLGFTRTLVLLNGRRLAAYPFGGSGVDVNSIPVAAIERIEVLRDGASAVYGSDAIGGVMNFITRRDFKGGVVTVGAESPQHHGGKAATGTVTMGFGDLAANRFNVLGVLDFQDYKAVTALDRAPWGSSGIVPAFAGIDDSFPKTSGNTFPANIRSFVPYVDETGAAQVAELTMPNPGLPNCKPPGSIHVSGLNCREDYTTYIDLFPPNKRTSLLLRGSFQATPNLLLTAEASKAKNEIIYHVAPVPTVTTGKPEYIYPAGGKYYPAGLLIPAICQGAITDANGVVVTPAIACPGAGTPYTGDLGISWRMIDTGKRTEKVTNNMDRLLLAGEGTLGGWDYKSGLLSTRSTAVDTYIDGYVSDPGLRAALATGNVNPWGPQDAAGQALLNAAKILQDVRDSKTTSDTFDIHGSRDLMQIGGGALAVAIGADVRREDYHDGYQPIFSTGNIVGGSGDQQPVAGKRNVRAYFAELNAPITKTLEASLAVRTDRYSDVGTSTTPKASLRWQPTKELLFRGSVGKGFRAPTLDDLYAPQSGTNSGSNYDDPFYLAQFGQGACPQGGGSILNCQIQVTVHQGGNAALKPEKSKSYTLGMVLEPTKNVTVSADYYHIQLDNAVNFLTGDTILADWLSHAVYSGNTVTSTSVFADRVHPDPVTGNLATNGSGYVQAGWVNLGQLQTSGIDLSVKGKIQTEIGTFSPGWEATYRLSDKQKLFATDPLVSVLGQYAFSGPSVRLKQALTLNWSQGPWNATANYYWQSGYQDQDDGDGAPLRRVGAYDTIDVQASYEGVKNLTLTAGIRNLMDRIPPLSNQGDYFQVGFDPTYADVKLRTFYLRASYKF